jgi:hypothetical protein
VHCIWLLRSNVSGDVPGARSQKRGFNLADKLSGLKSAITGK